MFAKRKILNIVKKLNIKFVDIHSEVFKSHKDPLSLFPFRVGSHFNAEGFYLISKAIVRDLFSAN